ncbi:transcription regulator hth arac- type [Lucifera butyrica]|uniref:Transcription regulator hth arac- type n=1 Tax=Lucifera butyrica TaxID=1351585 RepID=A0A498R3H6_9FIRM|nr:response regulator [Lucifera butyrica]VBB05715.1 transcription regulator hth arac- type [Lucifera butyrica]
MTKLLVADDEFFIRQGIISLDWNRIGVQVIGAVDNGIKAREIIQNESVDVVLADIRMPGMDGIELARFVKNLDGYTSVILLTGYNEFQYAKAAISNGVFEYLLKPTNPDEIMDSVKRAALAVGERRQRDRRLQLLEQELNAGRLLKQADPFTMDEQMTLTNMQRIWKYIKENYSQHISLSTLAESMHFSPVYLSRLIKKETNHTFLEILTAVRLKDAARKLRTTQMRIFEISESVGIDDQRYFSQVFKKMYGVTPLEYKKALGSGMNGELTCLIAGMDDAGSGKR